MSVTWTEPAALWLLMLVPLVWLALAVARTNFNRRQRALQSVVRSLVLIALVCAIGRPVIATTSDRQSIVYVVDVSHSVASRAIDDSATQIEGFNNALRPAHWRIVAFGATAAVLNDTKALRALARVDAGTSNDEPPDRRGTDLEAAMDMARAELVPGYVPRLVLFSDGDATAGDTTAAVARLAVERIPVSVQPMSVRSLGDTWIDAIDVPDRLAAGEPFAATVHVGSQREGAARVQLRADGVVLAERSVALIRGVTDVPLDASLATAGSHVLQATVIFPGDPLAVNDVLDRGVWAEPRARVLYVEGTPASAHYLSDALIASGFDVTVQPASALPVAAPDLDRWDAVILSDVARETMADASMSALSEWVEKRGGGLLVAGGESVYGENGYRDTPIEHVTPVTFERRDEPQVALIIVLDRSWSMSGPSIDLCKIAAQAAVDVMTDEQFVGILTFNDKFDWDVPLRNVGKNRDFIREKISAIEAAGQTLIYPAVEQAYLALRTANARAKHVILLSDGRSYPDDYEGLVKKMVDAHMTVSSVAVGPAADDELLGNIAKWGKGRSYVVEDPKNVPQIFVKEAKNAMTPAFDEKSLTPIVKAPAFLTGVDINHLPALKGRTATVIKDGALEVMASDKDEPLLAFWPVGAGRAAVFASDVKDRWAADWVTWRDYGPFFSSVVRAVERRRSPQTSLDVMPGPIHAGVRTLQISLEVRDASGQYRNLLKPVVRVQVTGGAAASLPLSQVSPGRYEGRLIADATKPVMVSLAGDSTEMTSRTVVPDAAAEYRFRPIDDVLLKSIASSTGGAWKPTAQALSNAAGDRRTERRPLWPGLIIAALCLWFLDLLLRRVRIFEPVVA